MSRLTPSLLALDKGLDLQTAKILAPEGSVYDTLNYEQVDFQGQKRIEGYTRYDGSALTAIDEFFVITTAAPAAVGNMLLKNGKVFGVVGVQDDNISYYIRTNSAIDVQEGDAVQVTSGTDTLSTFTTTVISISKGTESGVSVEQHYDTLLAICTALRSKVEHLPGAIAGLHWFKDRLYSIAYMQRFSTAPSISGSLPDMLQDQAVSMTYIVSGGITPYGPVTVTSGSLPTGLVLEANGLLHGTLTAQGLFSWTVSVTDAAGSTVSVENTMTVGDAYTVPVRFDIATAPSGVNLSLVADGTSLFRNSGSSFLVTAVRSSSIIPDGSWYFETEVRGGSQGGAYGWGTVGLARVSSFVNTSLIGTSINPGSGGGISLLDGPTETYSPALFNGIPIGATFTKSFSQTGPTAWMRLRNRVVVSGGVASYYIAVENGPWLSVFSSLTGSFAVAASIRGNTQTNTTPSVLISGARLYSRPTDFIYSIPSGHLPLAGILL